IRNIDNCVRCHKSADEHDIRMDPGASGKNERTINDQEKQNMNRFIEKQGKKDRKEGHEEDND
ncbi:MAG: hypothetical protein JNL88_01405, partial [Bacteroidia bacterium]|nr:hypothetical protein [Bacteroidia bacterium]